MNFLDIVWVQYGLVLACGALIAAFFSESFRLLRHVLLLAILIGGAVLLPPPLGHLMVFAIGLGVVYLLLYTNRQHRAPEMTGRATTFGSAIWATSEHLRRHDLTGTAGITLGVYHDAHETLPLHYTGNRHLLTVAPTRSGKGVAAIIPNLLTYKGSALIIDPKGENARISAARRGPGDPARGILGLRQTIHVVDPWCITDFPPSRFNPLDWLQPDDDISENAMMLADSIVVPRGGNEPFWDEEAKALLMGILLYVALDAEEQGKRHLGRVRDIITMGDEEFQQIMFHMREHENPIVASTADRTIDKDPKLRSNVITSLQSHTHFLDSPRMRKSLEASDFAFEDLKTSKMTVYLVLPADRLDTFGRWLRLLVQQAITVNARNIVVKPTKPILFLLDEMAALGRLNMVEQAYGLMAGFGMQLWGIVQDLSQLERIYDKGWETFIGNAGVLQYFGSRDHKTAEYFSKLCGVATIEKFSFNRSLSQAFGRSWSSSSGRETSSTRGSNTGETFADSTSLDVIQRPLVFPDELMTLRNDHQIILIEQFNPIQGQKVRWYEDACLQKLGIDLGP